MKKLISFALLLLMLLGSLVLTGCNSDKALENFLMFQPTYVGEEVTDTDHTFSKEDFKVTAIYTENKSEEVTDFSFAVKELKDGKFTIVVTWHGMEEELLVPLNIPIYPSETTGE